MKPMMITGIIAKQRRINIPNKIVIGVFENNAYKVSEMVVSAVTNPASITVCGGNLYGLHVKAVIMYDSQRVNKKRPTKFPGWLLPIGVQIIAHMITIEKMQQRTDNQTLCEKKVYIGPTAIVGMYFPCTNFSEYVISDCATKINAEVSANWMAKIE